MSTHDIFFLDNIFPEGLKSKEINTDFENLKPNESIMVLTNFEREYFPVLRYVTYDVVKDFKKITIENKEVFSFKKIVNRIGEDLKHGEKISLYDIENSIYKHIENGTYKIIVENNKMRINLFSCKVIEQKTIEKVKESLLRSQPDIRIMIDSGILEDIKIEYAGKLIEDKDKIKSKSIRY